MATARVSSRSHLSVRLQDFLVRSLADFPWTIRVRDWTDAEYRLGQGEKHWRGTDLMMYIRVPEVASDILGLNGMAVLERFVVGDIDFEGNLYLLTWIRKYAKLENGLVETIFHVVKNRAFQSIDKARVNVSSHYDIPQPVLEHYLDQTSRSYSCAMWEDTDTASFSVEELLRVGKGEGDKFDSLEKAQWSKFHDAATFADPKPGDKVLDIGTGYGDQLTIGAKAYPDARFVGWTHSKNQVEVGDRMRREAGVEDRVELRQGDYREDRRRYDHVLSTGMISHVGPRGLVPYVKEVRKRIKKGGRYLHHSLMRPFSRLPLEYFVGAAFNKKYVWPGFHWFSFGTHISALEQNGFRIIGERNLTMHYGKTTAAWYERMMQHEALMRELLGEQTFRAWQIYLSGASAGFRAGIIEVRRIYCEAI